MTPLLILLYIAVGVALVVAWAEIFVKAGHNRWLCLAMIVPVVNLIIFLWFAFGKWPVYEFVEEGWQIKRLRLRKEKLEKEILALGGTEELVKATKEEKETKLDKKRPFFTSKQLNGFADAIKEYEQVYYTCQCCGAQYNAEWGKTYSACSRCCTGLRREEQEELWNNRLNTDTPLRDCKHRHIAFSPWEQ